MKKRVLCGVIALLLLCGLCACGTAAPTVHTLHPGDGSRAPETVIVTVPGDTVIVTVPVVVTGTPVTTPDPEDTGETPVASDGLSYVMKNETRKLGNGSFANLTYPQLQNTGNAVAETNSNLLLAEVSMKLLSSNDVTKDYNDRVKAGSKVTFTVTDCTVTVCTPALCSVRFTATYLVDSGTPRSLIYTYLLNPSTGSEIKAKNVFSNFGGVLDQFEQDKMQQIYATDGFDKNFKKADWIKYYRDNILYKFTPSVYFTPDSLVVIAELSGSQGGWAEYSVALDTVAGVVKVKP